jgi:predicted outer membrane protein
MDSNEKALHQTLSGLKGAAFDMAYARETVRDHRKDVAHFE